MSCDIHGGPQPNDAFSRRGAGALRLGGLLYVKATSARMSGAELQLALFRRNGGLCPA